METEQVQCLFHGLPGEFQFSQDGWNALSCPQCGLLFVSPRPTPDAVAALYEQDAAHSSSMVHLRHFGTTVNGLAAGRTVKLLRKHRAGRRVLEVGPGSGTFLAAAREAGYDVAGVELNPVQAEHIRSLGIPCWSSLDEVEGTFDVVYHCDVTSHFYDPVGTFRQIATLLNDGGLHVFETGEGVMDPKFWNIVGNWQFPDHLFTFSDASLRPLLSESGFVPVEIKRYSLSLVLRIKNMLDRARGRSVPTVDTSRSTSTESFEALVGGPPPQARSKMDGLRVKVLSYPWHFMLYGLGAVLPRKSRPQAIVTVARKAA